MTWRDDAACRDEDPAVFFPEPGDTRTMNKAKAICAGCPVREDCAEASLDEEAGVWGGLSARRRRLIRNERARAERSPLKPCGTHAAFVRHKARGEAPCSRCVFGERLYQRAAKRAQRTAGRGSYDPQANREMVG